jgi:hypothetical protein
LDLCWNSKRSEHRNFLCLNSRLLSAAKQTSRGEISKGYYWGLSSFNNGLGWSLVTLANTINGHFTQFDINLSISSTLSPLFLKPFNKWQLLWGHFAWLYSKLSCFPRTWFPTT